ncbi:uncharacterized protein LOC126923117 isoform X2 [Bombus affinis]|uniref:uncharacterized protein LOC126923117 isoform X2 n=1 Tax=Bombus affinis TaxID=309941 RepID=UPI0021B80FE2|nr:uncharacterized protein LOC126923117 isoform X2 [Bombus affinis]
MVRNTKRKLAIFVGTSKCLIYAEAKYCASEMPGETKYYECSRTEYCCGIGCCVSPGLHFHHLWILVIIMFLVCSGGGWWYRYWLQGRYRAAASAIPTRTTNARAQSSLRGSTCQGQRARITYNSARNTVLLHRMWKGPQRNGAMPAYTGNATTSGHYQNMSVMLNDANCPYYQLYGPPPSYETVIAQTRGKVSNATSPESTSARSSSFVAPANSNVSQCFSYTCNFSTRLNNSLDQNTQYSSGGTSSRQLEGREGIPFAHFPPYCAVADGSTRQNVCIPFAYQEQPFVSRDTFNPLYQASSIHCVPYPMDKSSDTSDPENQSYQVSNVERYAMVNVDCTAGSSREQGIWQSDDRSTSKVRGSQVNGDTDDSIEKNLGEQRENTSMVRGAAGSASPLKIEENQSDDSKSVDWLENFDSESAKSRRVYGGSLKASGRYADKERCEEYSVQRAFSRILPHSCDGLINTEPATATSVDVSHNVSSLEERADVSASSFQSNPSNNVILERFGSDGASFSMENIEKLEQSHSRLVNTSTNSDLESKFRLDRSKSLD